MPSNASEAVQAELRLGREGYARPSRCLGAARTRSGWRIFSLLPVHPGDAVHLFSFADEFPHLSGYDYAFPLKLKRRHARPPAQCLPHCKC